MSQPLHPSHVDITSLLESNLMHRRLRIPNGMSERDPQSSVDTVSMREEHREGCMMMITMRPECMEVSPIAEAGTRMTMKSTTESQGFGLEGLVALRQQDTELF